jgi:CRISPR-associated protein Cas2
VQCLVLYDISDDRTRARVADACLDYGLRRVQYSAFCGRLSGVHQRELLAVLRGRVGREACNIQLLALDESCWAGRRTIMQGEGHG